MEPPRFYDRMTVGTLYLERAARVTDEAIAARVTHGIPEARADRERIAAFGIDGQVAFCTPGASLFVPGAVEDTVRTVEWLYRNLARITTLVLSLDTHSVYQIFHPAAWVDAEGRHPAPFTVISTDDVRRGRWRPVLRRGRRSPTSKPPASNTASSSRRAAATSSPSGRTTRCWAGASHALVPALDGGRAVPRRGARARRPCSRSRGARRSPRTTPCFRRRCGGWAAARWGSSTPAFSIS